MPLSIYTLLAPVYDTFAPLVSSRARHTGRVWLGVTDGETVVDIGTGTGLALPGLLAANPSGTTIGIDASPAMLQRARRRVRRLLRHQSASRPADARLLHADATSLPFARDTADAVFTSYMLDTMTAAVRAQALREIRRILRPGGRLVTLTMAASPASSFWSSLARRAPVLLGHAHPIHLAPELQRHGFSPREATTLTQLGFPTRLHLAG